MTDETTARVAPPAESPLLTEHVNVLMTEETRSFLLGSKIADGARSEGGVARALLESAITRYAEDWPVEYRARVHAGRIELTRRSSLTA